MAYNTTNAVVVGAATKKDHYDRLFDNSLAQKAAGGAYFMGGRRDHVQTTSGWVDLDGALQLPIDGTLLGGHTINLYVNGKVDTGTAQFRLWSETDSDVQLAAFSFTATSWGVATKSADITLDTKAAIYTVQEQINTAGEIEGGMAWLIIT